MPAFARAEFGLLEWTRTVGFCSARKLKYLGLRRAPPLVPVNL